MADEQIYIEVRRDLARLSNDLARGMGAAHLMIEQVQRNLAEMSGRVEAKIRDDNSSAINLAGELATLRTQLAGIKEDLDKLAGIPDRLVRLEAGHEHIRGDVTGKHEVEKTKAEVASKREDRELEAKKLASEDRRAKLQFWGAIAVVALPGIIAVVLQLVGLRPPSEPPEPPSIAAPPHHD